MASSVGRQIGQMNKADLGVQMYQCITDLFPFHRSISGDGVRDTLKHLQKTLPIEIHEVPTGTRVFDWTVPQEWRIHDAFIADRDGTRLVDYRQSNLQVLSGSQPISGRFSFEQLKPNLLTLPEEQDPDWIPYRTAFFRDAWGFCVSRRQLDRLQRDPAEEFDVVIDAEYFDGSLSYGEVTIPGKSDETILVYAHCCHPSLANDNLSGMAVAAFLGKQLVERSQSGDTPERTYIIVFAPATIGAITWLAQNESSLSKICGGLILSLLGDDGDFTYKKSRCDASSINRAVELTLSQQQDVQWSVRRFTPFGYDERQFCSPGINLPIGCLMRTPNGEFSQYHTSADNLDFVTPKSLANSLHIVTSILRNLEQNEIPVSHNSRCEPQLGVHGLYRAFGQHDDRGRFQEAVMWVLNLADGEHDLFAIAERGELPFPLVREAAVVLLDRGLIHFKI